VSCDDELHASLAAQSHPYLVSDIAGRQRLRSAHHHQLDVPSYRRTTLGRRTFSVAGPTAGNSLPDELREETENTFRLSLKTSFFRQY